MNPSALSVLAAAVLMAGVVALFVTWQPATSTRLPPAQKQSEPVLSNDVALDELQGFTWYYGDKDASWLDKNPFVPYQQRKETEEKRREIRRKPPSMPKPKPTPVPVGITPRPPPTVVKKPKFVPPPFTASSKPWVPKVYGQLHMADEQQCYVEKDGAMVPLSVGDSIGDWKLLKVTPQNAIFEDGDGNERILALGLRGESVSKE